MTTSAAETVQITPTTAPRRRGSRRLIGVLILGVILIAAAIYGVPKIIFAYAHVSTDDATVNSHVTYLSSRVTGSAIDVLVDDNQYVERDMPLIKLDPEPFKIVVEQRRAALAQAKVTVDQNVASLAVAQADLEQARNAARAQVAGLKAAWYLVATVQDLVRYETASLRSGAANLQQQEANLRLARQEYERVKALDAKTVSQEELDQRKAAVVVAEAQVAVASESIQQTRALLSLPPDTKNPTTLPADVSQTFAGTQYAIASAQQALSQLGLRTGFGSPRPGELRDQLLSLSIETVVEQSPPVRAAAERVKLAQAALGGDAFNAADPYTQPAVVEAQKQLEAAELDMRYTTIKAPISGFVSRRTVNPGSHVQSGQPLLAIRPLQDVWVDANFKETQLEDLRIGQAVELHVDAYPGHVFHGRVAGFSPGTGAMGSLLPPENATGNFVKVVQRLPVRIELTQAPPRETPLFAGLSVVPEVDTRAAPTGPDAGQRLLGLSALAEPAVAVAPETGRGVR